MHIVPAVTCNDGFDKDKFSLIVSAESLLDTETSCEEINMVKY